MGAPVPREVDEFFRKGLAREKKDRHQTAEELINEMLAAVANLSDGELDALPSNAAPSIRREGSGGSQSRNKPRPGLRTPSGGAPPMLGRSPLPAGVVVGGGSASVKMKSTSPEVPSAKKPSGTPPAWLKWAGIAAAVALLGGGAAVAFKKNGQSAEPVPLLSEASPAGHGTPVNVAGPREPPSPSNIEVKVISFPSGAAVFDGDRLMGQTPVTLRFGRLQEHRITLKLAGHNPVQQILDYSQNADDRTQVEIRLDPVAAKAEKPAAEKPEKTATTKPAKKKGSGDDIPVFE
jgi:hypothetical protein